MIQKDDYRHLPPPSQQNKLSRTILTGVIYFLFGALVCIGVFALAILLLIN